MKTCTTHTTGILDRWTRLLGVSLRVGLMAALAAPAIAVSQPQQPPVPLGTAEGFVILAASLISNIPTSAITGDVGLSPAAGSNITGLTSQEVTGTIYTVDASGPAGSVPNPTLLTAAQGDLTIAYNDAAGRTPVPTGPFLNPGSGNIGGLTLVPGLYKFTSSASITGSDVTLTGSSTDVWIFQIASDLTVGNDIKVILAGGAQAANIFWQVGTSATLGTNSVFKGTIMADQSISLNDGATLDGRALARIAAVTLASNTVTRPAGATGVENGLAPQEFALFQNYPNPFNPSTTISFSIPASEFVTLKVSDVLGSEIKTLVNEEKPAGSYNIEFNAAELSSGIYFYTLQAGKYVQTKKLILMK